MARRADVDRFLANDTLTSGTSAELAGWCDKILDGLRDVDSGDHTGGSIPRMVHNAERSWQRGLVVT
jgi:hypothetical protein